MPFMLTRQEARKLKQAEKDKQDIALTLLSFINEELYFQTFNFEHLFELLQQSQIDGEESALTNEHVLKRSFALLEKQLFIALAENDLHRFELSDLGCKKVLAIKEEKEKLKP